MPVQFSNMQKIRMFVNTHHGKHIGLLKELKLYYIKGYVFEYCAKKVSESFGISLI